MRQFTGEKLFIFLNQEQKIVYVYYCTKTESEYIYMKSRKFPSKQKASDVRAM